VEHGENGSRPDAGAQQNYGSFARPQGETSTGCADFEHVANPHVSVQESAGDAVDLLLYAHAVSMLARRTRHRIVPQDRGEFRLGPQSQDEKLARERGRQRRPVCGFERQRNHMRTFAIDPGDA
jgi:hypothetical protein